MVKFEFKSQICTSKKQSEKLLALGLKKETADIGLAGNIPVAIEDWKTQDTTLIDSPAWSLHRLLLLFNHNIDFDDFDLPNAYDTMIMWIADAIKRGYFNIDYLEDKQ